MGWVSKTFAAAAVACSSTATEAVLDHSTCPGKHSLLFTAGECTLEEGWWWRGEASGVSSDLEALSR